MNNGDARFDPRSMRVLFSSYPDVLVGLSRNAALDGKSLAVKTRRFPDDSAQERFAQGRQHSPLRTRRWRGRLEITARDVASRCHQSTVDFVVEFAEPWCLAAASFG